MLNTWVAVRLRNSKEKHATELAIPNIWVWLGNARSHAPGTWINRPAGRARAIACTTRAAVLQASHHGSSAHTLQMEGKGDTTHAEELLRKFCLEWNCRIGLECAKAEVLPTPDN